MSKVKEITCPECERVWPTISEQGVVTSLYERCYSCFISKVIAARDELVELADYLVHDCTVCAGLDPEKSKCIKCGGKGWETTDKDVATSPIKIVT